jgi:DNA modification methylase
MWAVIRNRAEEEEHKPELRIRTGKREGLSVKASLKQLTLEALISEPQFPVLDEERVSPRNQKRTELYHQYKDKLSINHELTRALVSFQANKIMPFYRWLKYKEAFSSEFVDHILHKYGPPRSSTPRVLDPFAGSGTTLTMASKAGWEATGIELLPVGIAAMRARLIADAVDVGPFEYHLKRLKGLSLDSSNPSSRFKHIHITERAFPVDAEKGLCNYLDFLRTINDPEVHFLFWFACLTILEEVSYTRKDGQYLRWDYRSSRALKSRFNKGVIRDFRLVLLAKLEQMLADLRVRNGGTFARNVRIIEGSALSELPQLPGNSADLIMTSPPYCNRYDYTRTYALELAFIGYDEDAVKTLRQSLLSATVENRTKRNQLLREYRSRNQEDLYRKAASSFGSQQALSEVLDLLNAARDKGELNNNNIPAMVENYFFEMNLVIHEFHRILAPGGHVVMVNDNVQYHGEEIPVDLILSDFAFNAGFSINGIWILPRGKGNSSQQMGTHGRTELRKCVYIWSKPPELKE